MNEEKIFFENEYEIVKEPRRVRNIRFFDGGFAVKNGDNDSRLYSYGQVVGYIEETDDSFSLKVGLKENNTVKVLKDNFVFGQPREFAAFLSGKCKAKIKTVTPLGKALEKFFTALILIACIAGIAVLFYHKRTTNNPEYVAEKAVGEELEILLTQKADKSVIAFGVSESGKVVAVDIYQSQSRGFWYRFRKLYIVDINTIINPTTLVGTMQFSPNHRLTDNNKIRFTFGVASYEQWERASEDTKDGFETVDFEYEGIDFVMFYRFYQSAI